MQGQVILSVDLNGTLLIDTIKNIPDAGFVKLASKRRGALLNKAEAISHMISMGNIHGAVEDMQYDLIPTVNDWLLTSYPTQSSSN